MWDGSSAGEHMTEDIENPRFSEYQKTKFVRYHGVPGSTPGRPILFILGK